MNQVATSRPPAETSPKSASRLGEKSSPLTLDPMISKSISRPFSFSMILGWAEVTVRLLASPAPLLVTMSPSAKGAEGSTSSVKGLSP